MNLNRILIVGTLMLALASCSTSVERIPAGDDKDLFSRVFTITSIDNELTEDQKENFLAQVMHTHSEFEIELVEDKSLGIGKAFKIELDVNEKTKKYIYRVLHSPGGFKDKSATFFLLDYINALKHVFHFNSPHSPFEAYYNAKLGDPIALEILNRFRPYNKSYTKEAAEVLEELKQNIKVLRAERKKEKDKRKKSLAELDAAPEGNQFRTYVAKNDRKGAAGVLRNYLPWEEMAPFEKQFWENYLDVMENPVPLDQRVIIYRGLDADYVQRGIVKGKVLTEKEAILQSNAFIISPVLEHNQGSWNRRLRSLETMNNKFIGTLNMRDDYTQAARITTMFNNHSNTPNGSPFLSLTPSSEVADKFIGDKVRKAAFVVDPRVINFNYATKFADEFEFLISITTFPDELIAISDTDFIPENKDPSFVEAYFESKLAQKVRAQYGEPQSKKIITKIKKNSYAFFKDEFNSIKDTEGTSPSDSNFSFFKKFADKTKVPLQMSPKGDLICKDLIQLFW